MAVANIIKIAAMHRVTDCYGPIPYSAIGFEGAIKTPYDSQEDVYNKFFEELAAARQILLDNPTAVMSPLVDKVYGGDISNWVRFANSLQLRLALRISYANKELAQAKAEDAIDPKNGGVIETNDQNATWKNYQTSTNSMRTAIMYNAHDTVRRPKLLVTSTVTRIRVSPNTSPNQVLLNRPDSMASHTKMTMEHG